MPRPTKAQLVQREAEATRQARIQAQEAKRATRIQVDQDAVLRVWIGAIIASSKMASNVALAQTIKE